jgi:phosphatidylinositol alpha-1,6-mannosyltransferase
MNFLFIMSDAYGGRGGMAEFNRELLQAVRDTTTGRITVLGFSPGSAPTELPPAGIEWIHVDRTAKVRFAARAMQLSLRSLDVVVAGHVRLAPVAAAAAAGRRQRRMWTLTHGFEAWSPPSSLRRRSFDTSYVVSAVSEFTRARILTWSRLAPDQIQIVPNTVDEDRFSVAAPHPGTIEKYGLQDRRVLLTVGRLAASQRHKGHDQVIRALPEISRQCPDVLYLIAGEGDDEPRLRSLAAQHGVSALVRFAGWVAAGELPDLFRAADVHVMPSTGDGFGIVYLEAACCGTPSVAARDNAGGEVIDRIGGEAVPSADTAALASAVCRLLTAPVDPAELRARALAQFGRQAFQRSVSQIVGYLSA